MPDFIKQQMRFQEKLGLPSIGTAPQANVEINVDYSVAKEQLESFAEQVGKIVTDKIMKIFWP